MRSDTVVFPVAPHCCLVPFLMERLAVLFAFGGCGELVRKGEIITSRNKELSAAGTVALIAQLGMHKLESCL